MAALAIRKRTGEAIALKLALTDRERRTLKRFMLRTVDEITRYRNWNTRFSGKNFGRVVDRDGRDITGQLARDEEDARMFLSRL
jgi:hypothetical protein